MNKRKKLLCLQSNNAGGCKLPAKADITAIYLHKKYPTSAGVITNEVGGASAQLVNSSCGKFNNLTYGSPGTEDIHNGTVLPFRFIIAPALNNTYETIISKYDSAAGEFFIYTYSVNKSVTLFAKDSVGTSYQLVLATGLTPGAWCDIEGLFDNGNVTWTVNGGALQSITMSINNIRNATGNKLQIGTRGNFPLHSPWKYFPGRTINLDILSCNFFRTGEESRRVQMG